MTLYNFGVFHKKEKKIIIIKIISVFNIIIIKIMFAVKVKV